MKHNIRIIRKETSPGTRGPSRGMCALQNALRKANFPWLWIGGHLECGDIPWVWLYKDAQIALQYNEFGWPFIIGPNVLFSNSYRPGFGKYEKDILDAENCRLMFTESEWYASLIQSHCNHNEAPIVIWSYPIEPQPDGPLPAEFDLLIYLKDMSLGRESIRAAERWPKSHVVVYGTYNRDALIEIARRSRACLYLCNDDRGPLAAAEIALAGCPLIGVERGCPWVLTPGLGVHLLHFGKLIEAEQEAMAMDRGAVREVALKRFATERTVEIIKNALEPITESD